MLADLYTDHTCLGYRVENKSDGWENLSTSLRTVISDTPAFDLQGVHGYSRTSGIME